MIKKIFKNLSAVVVLFLLFLLFIELILHILPVFLKPEIDLPEADKIILCVGDSSTYGLGASDRKLYSWPSQIEKLYNQNNKDKAAFINMALPGTNSTNTLKVLKSSLQDIHPDLIIVLTGINDAWNFTGSNIYDSYPADSFREKLRIIFAKLLSNSKLIRFLKLVKISSWGAFNEQTVKYNNRVLPSLDKQQKALYFSLKHNLSSIYDLCVKNGIPVFFLEYHAPGWGNPEVLIHRIYKEKKLPFIRLFDYFRSLDNQNADIRSKDHWHPNDKGYKYMALMISDFLNKNFDKKFPEFSEKNAGV